MPKSADADVVSGGSAAKTGGDDMGVWSERSAMKKTQPYPITDGRYGLNTRAEAPAGVKLPRGLGYIHRLLAKHGLVITGLAPRDDGVGAGL